jgi:hypothetical protein
MLFRLSWLLTVYIHYFISNTDIVSLISPSDIASIKELTLMLKIISQYGYMALILAEVESLSLYK